MNGADAIVFAGGIGENSPEIRARICAGLDWLGIAVDASKNAARSASKGGSTPPTVAWSCGSFPTDEELLIARDTWRVVTGEELT